MKNIITYFVAMAGIVMAFSMISQLEKRCVSAEKARDAYRPIVSQYFESQSGAEDSPPPPSITVDDKINLRMLDGYPSKTLITPSTAKWLTIAGFIMFAASISWQCRMEKKIQEAEQAVTPNA